MHRRRLRALPLLVSLVFCAAAASHAAVRETRVNPSNGHVYQVISQADESGMTWADAEAEAVSRAGHLVTINDAAENAWVLARFGSWRNELWIGYTDQAVEGTFEWISGQPGGYENWAGGEPSNSGDEDYVHMWTWDGRWNDHQAGYDQPYGVVEIEAPFTAYRWAQPVDGAFSDGGKWSPPGPPPAADGAYFDQPGAYTVTFTSDVTNLLAVGEAGAVSLNLAGWTYRVAEAFVGLTGPAELSLFDGAMTCTLGTLGDEVSGNGTLYVGAGAVWESTSETVVGRAGTGVLDVAEGGLAQTSGARIADEPGSLGQAFVSGAGASWQSTSPLVVGAGGAGALTVEAEGEVRAAGLFLGDEATATGMVDVYGDGSSLACVGGEWLTVGRQGGGVLTVSDGGVVATDSSLNIGGWTSGAGDVVVTGGNTVLSVGGELIAGDGGDGSLTVEGGALAETHGLTVGRNWPGSGEVVIRNAGTDLILHSGWLVVGGAGTARMVVQDGARVDAADGVVQIGRDRSGTGSLTVLGAGSRVVTSSEYWVGDWGAGLLEVLDGAEATGWGLRVGIVAPSAGSVHVSGPDSRMALLGGAAVGESGFGSMAVRDGAVVEMGQDLGIGRYVGSRGEVGVQDPNSRIQVGWGLRVGQEGEGSLLVTDGGQVSAQNGQSLGDMATGRGEITVRGVGSRVENTSWDCRIGQWGSGSVHVSAGGEVFSDGWIGLGLEPNSTGSVHVCGAGSSLRNRSSGLTIGNAGAGDVHVLAGGAVSVDNEIILGDQATGQGVAIVDGAGSRLESRNNGFRVGRRGVGTLIVSNGGAVSGHWATVGNEDAAAKGTAIVRDANSTWAVQRELTVGDIGWGRLEVRDGGRVTVGSFARIGHQPTSEGEALVTGIGSRWEIAEGLGIGNAGVGSLTVADGGVVTVGWDTDVQGAGEIALAGGRFEGNILRFHGNGPDLTGYGTIAARVHGGARALVVDGGTLTAGDGAGTDGFSLNTSEGFSVAPDATLEVLDADYAQFWGPSFQITNGVLIGRNGLEINCDPNGYGIIVGPHTRAIDEPAGRVDMTQPLDVGTSVARVYSDGIADLGTYTTIAEGGVLIAPDGVRVGLSGVLAGGGMVGGDCELAGGVLAAEPGQTFAVTARLSGYGVTVGDVRGFIEDLADPNGTVVLGAGLDVGGRTARVYSAGPAGLGAETTLAGGSIEAVHGLAVGAGETISGHGVIEADVALVGGSLRADGGPLGVAGTVRGHGLLINGVAPDVLLPPDGTVALAGERAFGLDNVLVHSAGPAWLGQRVCLGGGSITAANGLDVPGGGALVGYGTIHADVAGRGVISPTGGTLWFTGQLDSDGGSIVGEGTLGLGSGGFFAGEGSVDAGFASVPGSTLVVADDLALGRPGGTGVALGGLTVVGEDMLQLRGGRALISGEMQLAGGMLLAEAGMDIAPGALLTGRGVLRAGTTLVDAISNEGTLAVGGDTDIRGDFVNRPGGKVTAAGGASLAFWEDVTHNGDFMKAAANSFLTFFGSYAGSGPFTGGGTVTFQGDLHPGASPAMVRFEPSVRLTGSATFVVELAEPDNADPADPKYDALVVEGDVALGGALALTWLPRPGDLTSKFGGTYDLLVYRGERTGSFAVEGELAAYCEGIEYDVDLGDGWKAVRVTLAALLDGDVDLDGAVTERDLAILESGFGGSDPTWRTGDVNLDAGVDHLDYLLWKAHAGTALPGFLPEPAALALLAAAAAVLALRRKR